MKKSIRLLILAIVALVAVIALRSKRDSSEDAAEPPAKSAPDATKGGETLHPIPATDSRVQEPTEIATTPAAPPAATKSPEPTISMHLRIVDRATNAPIAGAVIVRARGEGATLESDVDGRCGLTALLSVTMAPQFSQEHVIPQGFCRVRAQGYAYGEFREEEGHESADKALEVKLDKAATLAVALLHRPVTETGAYEVRASAQWQDLVQGAAGAVSMDVGTLQIEAACDAQGFAVLESLNANVPLTVQVFQGKTLVRGWSEPLKLEAGARRELEIDLGGACHLTGKVVDSSGAAAPGIAVWLVPKGVNPIFQFEGFYEKNCVAKARADAEGRFDLGEIPPGKFWIGPGAASDFGRSPNTFRNVLPKGQYELDFAAVNAVIEITADERAKAVDVRIERGVTIEGIVLDPDGHPMPGTATVMAHSASFVNSRTECGPDGKFTLGPLVSSTQTLHAYGGTPTYRYADSVEVQVEPGARDVVIRLRQGASLTLRVVDHAGGEGIRANLIFEYVDNPSMLASFSKTDEKGNYNESGITPSRASVVATTADGRVGFLPLLDLTTPGAHDFEVVVNEGAKLTVRPPDGSKTFQEVCVYRDGVLVAESEVRPDGSAQVFVPPGTLVVRSNSAHFSKALEQTVTIAAGEEREVVLGP